MFGYFSDKQQGNVKRIVSSWLKAFVIEPSLRQDKTPEAYLKGFDRKKAAESCYEYLVLMNELNDSLSQVDKKKLVKDIAMYIDLRTPFIYSHKQFGTPDYKIDKQFFEEIPFHYNSNTRKALSLIQEAQKSMVLNHKTKWALRYLVLIKQFTRLRTFLSFKIPVLRLGRSKPKTGQGNVFSCSLHIHHL